MSEFYIKGDLRKIHVDIANEILQNVTRTFKSLEWCLIILIHTTV